MDDVADVHLPAGFIRAVASATDQDAVLRATATWMPRIIEADRSSVALAFDDELLEIRSMGGMVTVLGTFHPIANSIVGTAFRTRKIHKLDSLTGRPETDAATLSAAGLESAIASPLISGGRCLGTINLAKRAPGFYDETHEELLGSITDLIASFLNHHQLAQVEKTRAATDALTGTLSRRAALDELDRIFHSPEGKPAVLFIDLDGFKEINDTHGHSTGDEVLRELARRIQPLLGPDDRFGRLGGDEFIAIIHADPEGARATRMAAGIVQTCTLPVTVGNVRVRPNLSIGVAFPHTATCDASTLLGDADHAMYAAKGTRRSIVVADEEIRRQIELVAAIDRDLRTAMDNDEIVFHYQPIRHLESLEIVGAEALVRWTHPEHGPIPPPLLIERVEATGRIPRFTAWGMDAIARDLAQVRQQVPAYSSKSFAYNLTPSQLSWNGCAATHAATCARYGFERSDLLVEVVESSEIQPDDPAERTLKQMANDGALIALDDFGVGHNALAYFTRFPIHALKLDQSLVRGMADNEAARSILRGLTSMARELNIIALAEGVETVIEEAMCREAGIHHGQGWHFGRPAPIDEFTALVRAESGGIEDAAA